MKTIARIKRPTQHTAGVRERPSRSCRLTEGPGKGWREEVYKSPVRGHGALDELEKRLAAITA
jgi:hypothetical protein